MADNIELHKLIDLDKLSEFKDYMEEDIQDNYELKSITNKHYVDKYNLHNNGSGVGSINISEVVGVFAGLVYTKGTYYSNVDFNDLNLLFIQADKEVSIPSGDFTSNVFIKVVVIDTDNIDLYIVGNGNNGFKSFHGKGHAGGGVFNLESFEDTTSEYIPCDLAEYNYLNAQENSEGGIHLKEPTNISAESFDEAITIKWTDPEDIYFGEVCLARWDGTLIVRKVGSAPTNKTDGVIILDSKIRNSYSENGFTDSNGLVNGIEYFYGIFPYTDSKVYTTTESVSATPVEILPEAPYDVSVKGKDKCVTLTFSLPSSVTMAKIVYGTHSPTSPTDGTVIETTTSPYEINGLENDTEYFFAVYSFNTKGRYAVSDIVSATPTALEIVSWANGTDEQISAMLEAHYAGDIDVSTIWAVGDIRNVSLGSMTATGVGESHASQEIELVIIDFKHDDLASGGKAAVTVQQRDSLSEYGYMMNSSNTNVNRWNGCARRTWCNNVYKKALPTALSSLIKTVAKKVSAGSKSSTIITSNDDVFMVSEVEVFGQTTYSFAGEGTQYEYYKTTANRVKYQGTARETACHWWERSPYSGNSTYFCFSYSSGSASLYSPASDARGIAPAFCL